MIKSIIDFFLNNKKSILKFLLIGLTAYFLYMLLLAFCLNFLHFTNGPAVTCAYFFTVCFHFISNRRYTFQQHDSKLSAQLVKYIVTVLINYVITMLVVGLVTRFLFLSPYFAVTLSVAITMVLGFLLFRFWVFQPTPARNLS